MRVKERNESHTEYTAAQVSRIIEACKTELATNFASPSRSIISAYAAQLGMSYETFRKMIEDTIE